MEYTKQLYPKDEGYGFYILCDENPIINQDYMPDVDGNVVMTEQEANDWADIILERLK